MDVPERLKTLDIPWWIGGSRALEQFTAVRRPHTDTDVGIFLDDVDAFLARFPEAERVSPDRLTAGDLDVWLHRRWNDDWVFPLDPTLTLPLDGAMWVSDGVRYLRPELVLLFKAEQKAIKDLETTLPWLREDARKRLATLLDKIHPGHAWLDLIH